VGPCIPLRRMELFLGLVDLPLSHRPPLLRLHLHALHEIVEILISPARDRAVGSGRNLVCELHFLVKPATQKPPTIFNRLVGNIASELKLHLERRVGLWRLNMLHELFCLVHYLGRSVSGARKN